jgi:methyl-accepting chemotaxis protein
MHISGKNVTLQTAILVVLLGFLLLSRIFLQNLWIEVLLIIFITASVLVVYYFHKERAEKAAQKASLSLTKSKYSSMLSGEVGHTDETLAIIISDIAAHYKELMNNLMEIVEYSNGVASKSDQISLGTEAQSFSMEETSSSIQGISDSIITLVEMVDKLFPNAEKATKSILEMVDSNKKISLSTQDLFTHVKDVSSHIDIMVKSVDDIEKQFANLMASSEGTSKAVKRIDSSIKDIEEKASRSFDLADQVRSDAEVGASATTKTIEGMSRIKEIVTESAEVIQKLGERSGEVGDIINVINDITDRTNLLALNASIIAAQAGEHGKGFSVVAEEIKRLADQTAQSTVEISDLIQNIQGMVSDVIQANEMGKWSAEEGVRLSNEADGALRKILESTQKSSEMSRLIADATIDQSKETITVIGSIQDEVNVIQEIASAIREDAVLSEKIRDVTTNMVNITGDVAKANTEQEKANSEVTTVIEEVKDMIRSMFDITRTQKNDSDQILQAIEIMKYISLENISAIKELSSGTGELKTKITKLNKEFQDIGL